MSQPTYRIFDNITRSFIGSRYRSRKRASARADYLDTMYGAVRYIVQLDTQAGDELRAQREADAIDAAYEAHRDDPRLTGGE